MTTVYMRTVSLQVALEITHSIWYKRVFIFICALVNCGIFHCRLQTATVYTTTVYGMHKFAACLCVARGKLFPESTVRNITIQVMNGLAFMHKHGRCCTVGILFADMLWYVWCVFQDWEIASFVYCLQESLDQEIVLEKCRNDLFCVEWDVKPQLSCCFQELLQQVSVEPHTSSPADIDHGATSCQSISAPYVSAAFSWRDRRTDTRAFHIPCNTHCAGSINKHKLFCYHVWFLTVFALVGCFGSYFIESGWPV